MNRREHLADELKYQLERVYTQLGDLPPTGGLGWSTLDYGALAAVAYRAIRQLREDAQREDGTL